MKEPSSLLGEGQRPVVNRVSICRRCPTAPDPEQPVALFRKTGRSTLEAAIRKLLVEIGVQQQRSFAGDRRLARLNGRFSGRASKMAGHPGLAA
jgi:hypothetical protein